MALRALATPFFVRAATESLKFQAGPGCINAKPVCISASATAEIHTETAAATITV